MKNLSLVGMALVLLSYTACAQSGKDVPEKVQTAFAQKFATSSHVKWSKENDSEWEAEFKMDKKDYSVNFSTSGEWMETEYKISTDELPAAVKATIQKEFDGYKIEESELSETADGKMYEVELEKGDIEMEAIIDANGKLIKKETIKEDKDEDKETDDD